MPLLPGEDLRNKSSKDKEGQVRRKQVVTCVSVSKEKSHRQVTEYTPSTPGAKVQEGEPTPHGSFAQKEEPHHMEQVTSEKIKTKLHGKDEPGGEGIIEKV